MAKREGVYDAHSSDIQLTKANICNCVRFSNNMKIKQGDYETHRERMKGANGSLTHHSQINPENIIKFISIKFKVKI